MCCVPSIALCTAAIAGCGIVLLPDFVASAPLAGGRLQRLLPDWHVDDQHIHAVYPAHRERAPKVRALIDFLVAEYADAQALTSKA